MSAKRAVVLDCYTVEPSGLGVPPYLSTYVRQAYAALATACPQASISYLTIDDLRWCWNGAEPHREPPLTDPLTCSTTVGRDHAASAVAVADAVVVVAGDTVPSVHLHAQNGSLTEVRRVLSTVAGHRVLLGPLAASPQARWSLDGLVDATHTHTITSSSVIAGSVAPASYDELTTDRCGFEGLVAQIPWSPIAEIELYRGCTRRRFCSFCHEPVKNPSVVFRSPEDVRAEVRELYAAGVRHFRLGQQTCFFSYLGRDVERIRGLLAGIRADCSDLDVLHIDNADPLAVASPAGARIAALVAEHCTDGNCAPMGIESFDPDVIDRNALTCTPDVLRRAVDHVNEVGAGVGPHGVPRFLPGLNLVYGLPGETPRTHTTNLAGLERLLDDGVLCHRTNVRAVDTVAGTPLALATSGTPARSAAGFDARKAEISEAFDLPMKKRVYPTGGVLRSVRPFFVSERGTWYRRLGSYSIQVVEEGAVNVSDAAVDMQVTGHSGRYIYGRRVCMTAR